MADVCLRAEDAALIAVLVRALVESACREWRDGVEPAPVPTVLLRMAAWQASNFGLRGELLDFGSFRPAPAEDVVRSLVDFLEPVLAENRTSWNWPGKASRRCSPGAPALQSSATSGRWSWTEQTPTTAGWVPSSRTQCGPPTGELRDISAPTPSPPRSYCASASTDLRAPGPHRHLSPLGVPPGA